MRLLLERTGLGRRDLWAAASISAAACSLLCGYELLRSSSNTLFQAAYGVHNLPAITAVMPLGTLAGIYLYGRILTALGPRRTLALTSLASGAAIAACYWAIRRGFAPATAFLYIFREAYIVIVIEQYWSFLDSTFSEASARKLNSLITGVGSLGGIAGGLLLYRLSERLGTPSMLLFAAGSLVPAALASNLAYARCGEPAQAPEKEPPRALGHLGLSSFKGSPMLVLLLLLVALTQVVSTVLTLGFQTSLQQAIPELDRQTAYSGWFYAVLQVVAAFMQFVGTPLLLACVPVVRAQLAIPVVHTLAAASLLLLPGLASASAALLLFKALDYSLFKATKEILYIPLSFDARYRAKEIIDAFGYRFSKGGTSLAVMALQGAGIAAGTLYASMSLAASLLWLSLVVPLTRRAAKPR